MHEIRRLRVKLINKLLGDKSTMSPEEAIKIADRFGMAKDVITAMNEGYTPEQALDDWDLPQSMEEADRYFDEVGKRRK